MSDLRSEIVNKVLNSWEKPMVESKKTLGERIYEFVKAHPYSSVDEIERGLDLGKESSVSSYLKTQMDKGLLDRESKVKTPYPGFGSRNYYVYYHVSDTYNLPKKPRKPRVDKKPQLSQAERIQQDILAPLNERLLHPRMPRMPQAFNAETFVEDLSLKDARAVYELLKGYFSG